MDTSMEIKEIKELGTGGNYYKVREGGAIESIIFNEAMVGSLTYFYEYSTYEITLKDGSVIIVPSKDFTALYAPIEK